MIIKWCFVKHHFCYLGSMSPLPLFFLDAPLKEGVETWLSEDTAKHIVQVLRMQSGEQLQLTDGKGRCSIVTIEKAEKKKCSIIPRQVTIHPQKQPALHMAIAFTKNSSRNEWLLEKITELGVASITPLMATRTERERIRYDRWANILVSALLQSQQYYLPKLNEAQTVKQVINSYNVPQQLIAHCITEVDRQPIAYALDRGKETLILIGPEGDFTKEEVQMCMDANFVGISMGGTRLRTETAAMTACSFFNMMNYESA